MAATDGYHRFGGGNEDYVRQQGSDTILTNVALTLTEILPDGTSGAVLTDLLNANTQSVSDTNPLLADDKGEFIFWARPTRALISAPGSGTYEIFAKDALGVAAEAGARIVTLEAAVATLQQGGGGAGVLTIYQNADGSWPARTTKTNDRAVRVEWQTLLGSTAFPNISTALSDAVLGVDRLLAVGA